MSPFDLNRFSFNTCLRICAVLLLALGVTFFGYVWSEKQIDAASFQRYSTRLLVEELRQSADDLTRMARSYAATGDTIYQKYFYDILAIRDGKKPRPQQYIGGYWDLAAAGKQPYQDDEGPSIALLALMKQNGFTEAELEKLALAKARSDALSVIEFQAMHAIALTEAEDTAVKEQARALMFGAEYQRRKAEILEPIEEAIHLSDARTQRTLEAAEQRARYVRYSFVGLGLSLLMLLLHIDKLFRKILGGSPQRIYRQIIRLGNGDFAPAAGNPPAPLNSVMGYLQQTLRQLQALEEIRICNERSLHLAAKVFSETREGIFMTDRDGILLDVNQAFLDMTGFQRDEVLGRPATQFNAKPNEPEFFNGILAVLERENHWRGEAWNRKKNGETFAEILSMTAVYDHHQSLLCYLGLMTDITQLKQHQQKIEQQAFHDPLTQLPNRSLLSDRMRQALARAERNKALVAVICLDLDGFKEVNDRHGHGIGDIILVEVAERLTRCTRTGDTVARMGGDEFVVLLSEIVSHQHCETTLQRILKALASPFPIGLDRVAKLSASIGYTLFPEDQADADTLLRHADHAMYSAKQAGKNRYSRFDILEEKRYCANAAVLSRIESALDNREFKLYIQPKLDLRSGKIIGGEALIRWLHPIRGIIPPNEFLPLIEHHVIGGAVGEWVIAEALRLMQTWSEQGLHLPISVNITIQQLKKPDFYSALLTMLQTYSDVAPAQLELEIIESAALEDMHRTNASIHDCQALGIRFALDDFGTGYSSLAYLKRLAIDALKIDRSFIQGMLADENDLTIVRGVIGLARAFSCLSVAEGMETWQHATLLRDLGCDVAQGYAIAAPMPSDEFPDWLKHFAAPDF